MKERLVIIPGLLIWLGVVWLWGVAPPEPTWVIVLTLFSPLVLMPLAEPLFEGSRYSKPVMGVLHLLTLVALIVGLWSSPGWMAAGWTMPWLLLRLWMVAGTLNRWRSQPPRTIGAFTLESARLFPAVGAAWLVAFALGWNPLGFDRLIVLLTGAHFHHAGFTLPLLAGCVAQRVPSRLGSVACWLILLGIPLVAFGITWTHLVGPSALEGWMASVLVVGCLGVVWQHLRLAMSKVSASKNVMSRVWFVISGLALLVAMTLAQLYALRDSGLPMPALPLGTMWATHGTLNTFGFGLLGILGWRKWLR